MHAHVVTTADGSLLTALRSTLLEAEESLLCVAFVSMEGVHLIEKELRDAPSSLLATTVFGTTQPAALNRVLELGSEVRTYNSSRGTYHPKVYLGRRGDRIQALVGSSNLTGGLIANVEAATWMKGRTTDPELTRLWDWGHELWERPQVTPWLRTEPEPGQRPVIDAELFALLRSEVARDPVFMTLGASPRRNRVVELTPSAVYVETERTRSRETGAQPIPAKMFNLAWAYLETHGRLENRVLLNQLRVHRSSAVCAILARLPGVIASPGRAIALELEDS